MKMLGYLTVITLSTRFYNLSYPEYVCWDETHFGKMAGLYLNRTYFIDVHPPLGKMMFAITGYLTGYDGNFAFASPGDEYRTDTNRVRYYGMRSMSAILGSMVIPLIYSSVMKLSGSYNASLLTTVLLVFDCGLITLCQYILLDPIFLFFVSATIFCMTKISYHCDYDNRMRSFSLHWWFYLALSGICLGCVLATKLTGLLTVIFIGSWTLNDLLKITCNVKKCGAKHVSIHFLARVLCLILIPCSVYVTLFYLNYQILYKSGRMDGFHSSQFQSCLVGNPLHNSSMPLHVAFGSLVTLKHHSPSASGLLHSDDKLYPIEVMPFPHQQTTVYYHRDANNFWQIVMPTDNEYASFKTDKYVVGWNETLNQVKFLSDGSVVKIKHIRTGCHLHSMRRKAPLTKDHQIVSCNNHSSQEGKLNELWRLEVVNRYKSVQKIEVLSTTFKIVHVNTGCVLESTFKILPEWGEKQYEVTCASDTRNYIVPVWNIEQHTHRKMDNAMIPYCNLTFWDKFWESHLAMLYFNSQMKSDELKHVSKPWHWPVNYKGQVFTRMGEDDLRVYLLGNPFVFWLNFLVIILSSVLVVTVQLLRKKKQAGQPNTFLHVDKIARLIRGPKSKVQHIFLRRLRLCKFFLFAWAVHYIPFFFMSRVLYFHHYYPAFLFSCCLTGCFLDEIFNGFSMYFSRVLGHKVAPVHIKSLANFVIIFCLLQSFYLYSPLCYGMVGPFADGGGMMRGLKLFSGWEI